ncbi:alpha/beta hydrolase [Qipengyuania sp. XHP0207]|uniref:alpha/beta fold hydrolase n=1 Tax=Qipengyuania sp. XHP0207 TaxID=3038078 RepID=UPI00241EB544|nr:alpha/beta hydrolase [Qipengyuania sp. XHP0207]MDG5748746.1 alpha/beta hydrolase [Qipengyuania sp. XHP0207]
MDTSFSDRSWQSADGLTLHFRDYGKASARPPIICLHGLTRNARDFENLATHLVAQGWRVIVPDMRGRGDSEYASDSATYALPVYVGDVLALLQQEAIERFVSIGTSMGGLMTMILATMQPERLAGVVLNDIGPALEMAGLEAIKGYVGQGRSFATWMHAARALEEVHAENFPGFDVHDWLRMAKRGMTLASSGRIVFDYDMKIADPILAADEAAVPPDLWPAFEALGGRPVLLLRGEVSPLLSEASFAQMQQRMPEARAVTVPRIGHAPTLDEPQARAAIDELLEQVR